MLLLQEPGQHSKCCDLLQAGQSGVQILACQGASFTQKPSRLALGPTQPYIQWLLGSPPPGVQGLGYEVDHWSGSSAKVKNEWSYISACSPL